MLKSVPLMKLGVRLSWFGVRKTVNIDALLESLGATASRIVNALSSAARRKPETPPTEPAEGGGPKNTIKKCLCQGPTCEGSTIPRDRPSDEVPRVIQLGTDA